MNKNEVGRIIAVNIADDISTASVYEIILSHNKYSLTVGALDGVLRPDVDLVFIPCDETDPVTYLANQYLTYVTKEGDIPFSGIWEGRSHIEFVSPTVDDFFGDIQTFQVGE